MSHDPPLSRNTRGYQALLLIGVTAVGLGTVPGSPVDRLSSLAGIDTAQYRAEWNTWRAGRAKSAVAPGRPLSYTGLTWLHAGANTIGARADNQVRLVGRDVPDRVGVLVRDGAAVRIEPAPGVTIRIDSTVVSASAQLRTDADRNASQVAIGSAGFRIVKRVDSIGVRAWDSERRALKTFAGIEHFPLDQRWRVDGRFVPLATPRRVAVMTESGVPEEHEIVGTVETTIDRAKYALTAFKGGRGNLFITFADGSSGEESYGFRFVQAKLDTVTRAVTLDFNFAYNPDCAFSPYTTCPLPPPENRIRAKLLGGERKLAFDRGTR